MTMAADGSKMIVDAATCYGCGLCVDVCPPDAISATVRTEGRVPFAGKAGE
jgi:indolepyruvate ferredoxin oxidoreductase alpha subunit